MVNLELLIGLVAIAIAIFFGLWGFRKGIMSKLSAIKETVEKTWDLILTHFPTGGGTVVRELDKLGKVSITAEPATDQTVYLIEIEKPILREGLFFKKALEWDFQAQKMEILGKEAQVRVTILSPHRMRYRLPSTDSKACTEFVTFLLKWINSTYFESLKDIKQFEEPILT